VAAQKLDLPIRMAKPERLTGMADSLRHPSYSTSVGLLKLGLEMDDVQPLTTGVGQNGVASGGSIGQMLSGFIRRLLPDDGE